MKKATKEQQDRMMLVNQRLISGMQKELTSGEISKSEALCLFAYVTGMLIAMQDQRTMRPEQAMDLVSENIAQGNKAAIESLFSGPGGTA